MEKQATKAAKKPAQTAAKTVRKATPVQATPSPAIVAQTAAVATFITRMAEPGKTVSILDEKARPVAGKRLAAHTPAALTVLALLQGGEAPKKAALSIMGQRAISYHLAKRTFESTPGNGIRLTITGRNEFKNRFLAGRVDIALANAYTSLFLDGKNDPLLGVADRNIYSAALGI